MTGVSEAVYTPSEPMYTPDESTCTPQVPTNIPETSYVPSTPTHSCTPPMPHTSHVAMYGPQEPTNFLPAPYTPQPTYFFCPTPYPPPVPIYIPPQPQPQPQPQSRVPPTPCYYQPTNPSCSAQPSGPYSSNDLLKPRQHISQSSAAARNARRITLLKRWALIVCAASGNNKHPAIQVVVGAAPPDASMRLISVALVRRTARAVCEEYVERGSRCAPTGLMRKIAYVLELHGMGM
ncbi:hypothetical protein CYLTODRAFT_279943 [Cylindrobasidium torrendii FP15055 ss-10]|uniref:Uncharacterized protein n=1 Tax=Cylindrobasidium torrendii FP15055 ss-10 TaxID=1314674 RepID=A0A0D7BE11_9AGAR|nr:hypothetical protein CYLTODRAFT_279943 [Cylindrobasidium torrendii FP15055 ss-10]